MILACSTHTKLLQNDHLYLSHYHNPEDGYSNLEQSSDWIKDDRDSSSSVIHRSPPSAQSTTSLSRRFSPEHVQTIKNLSQDVVITAETKAYLHNLVVFLRLNRAVRGGASPIATTHFEHLSRYSLQSCSQRFFC